MKRLQIIGNDFAGQQAVIEAWKEYLDKLNSPIPEDPLLRNQFFDSRDTNFHELIFQMSAALGYKFTRLEIQKQYYTPQAHGTWAEQQTVLREGVVSLLRMNQRFRFA
jgi:hypothetical protein